MSDLLWREGEHVQALQSYATTYRLADEIGHTDIVYQKIKEVYIDVPDNLADFEIWLVHVLERYPTTN